ncbi:hypothetical protein ACLOJK_030049 [Asimina triloba]
MLFVLSTLGGGDDVHGRLTSPVAPSFGRVYDQEDDHNQPAKKSVLTRVREKARKWRQTLLKKRHGQDGANATPAWGVTLEEDDDDDDDFQGAPTYESLGNGHKDTHNRNPFSPPATTTNNDNNHGSKHTPKTTAEKLKHEHSTKAAAAQIADVSTEKKQHENRETQSRISRNPSSSAAPQPDDHDQQPISEKKEDKDHASVKNPTSPPPPPPLPPASAAADEDNDCSENPPISTPGFLAEKLAREGKTITPLPAALLNEKRGWVDAPVRNPSPMPAKGHNYRDKSMSRRTLHASPVASIKEEPQHMDTPFIHSSTLMRKPSPVGAADQHEYYKFEKIAADPAAEMGAVKSGSSKTLTEMVADTLQPVYNMVSGATQNVAMKFQGGGGAAEGRNVEGSGRACNSRLEKSVSVKEYLMQKLEPGAEERALSRVISDVMAPKNAAAKAEVGVMGKMRDAVTSFLGMEQDSSSSPAPGPPNDNRQDSPKP